MNMREKMAHAICGCGHEFLKGCEEGKVCGTMLEKADAVLSALMDPTDGMTDFCEHYFPMVCKSIETERAISRAVFIEMISAARDGK